MSIPWIPSASPHEKAVGANSLSRVPGRHRKAKASDGTILLRNYNLCSCNRLGRIQYLRWLIRPVRDLQKRTHSTDKKSNSSIPGDVDKRPDFPVESALNLSHRDSVQTLRAGRGREDAFVHQHPLPARRACDPYRKLLDVRCPPKKS